MATAAAAGGAGKWIAAGVVVLALVTLLVWAGTRFAAGTAAAPTPDGVAYLAANKDKPGVHTTASGLQYEILTDGTGPRPTAADTVTVHYVGKLIDGTTFDSSVERGQPATFPLRNVIPGWTEGVALMPVGATYRFTIPPELGYGAAGAGGVIPPNAVLVFEVQLLSIAGR